eukprot:1833529-Prymnesium_polylepis.1
MPGEVDGVRSPGDAELVALARRRHDEHVVALLERGQLLGRRVRDVDPADAPGDRRSADARLGELLACGERDFGASEARLRQRGDERFVAPA